MEHWERTQRARGNIAGAEMARTLREQFGDVAFPNVEASPLQTPETPVDIKRFSPEQKEALEKQGFVIRELTGQSIKTLRDSGRKFQSTWHNSYPDLEAFSSMHTEVAISPNQLFLPNSNRKTLKDQEKMVEKFSKKLSKQIPGIKAIIGDVADYAELAFAHLGKTEGKEYLIGEKYGYDYARTKTKTGGSDVALVGNFRADYNLHIDHWYADNFSDRVWISPLIVPAK